MINFLSVLQQLLFFLLISVSSEKCRERNVIHVTGGIKEYSQTGYYYGTITTPNFPQKFPTPFNVSYVIDASNLSNDSQIYVYLTQMYISRGVKFFHRPSLDFCKHNQVKPIKPGARHQCRIPNDRGPEEIGVNTLHDTIHVSTSCPYLEIEVNVPELYGYHYRTREPFLFDVYGFNITYEIVPERLGAKNDTCNSMLCSNLGHCYLAQNWRDFYCDCVKDHPGRYCNISSRCDPENNVTFCLHGGQCRIIGSGEGYCDCNGTGYYGIVCEKRNEQPKVSARTGTSSIGIGCSSVSECPIQESSTPHCSPETSKGPCVCRPSSKSGRVISKDWRKYEATISLSKNFTMLPNQSSVGYELQKNISRWFQSHNLADLHNVLVSFHPPPRGEFHPRPKKLLIHFYGPLKLQTVQEQLRQYLFSEESTTLFRRQIPLENGSLEVSTMPRLKNMSIEVGKTGRLKIGRSVGLTCTATTGRSAYYSQRDYQFRWFKDGLPINASIATRHMQIFQNLNDEDETKSIIIIDDVSAFDGGSYTCEITDVEFGDQECRTKEVEVILPPQIEIEPMSLTLEKRNIERGVVITCTDGSYSANKSVHFVWTRGTSGSTKELVSNDDVVVLEDIVPQGKLLRILRAEHSESFTCSAFNKEGEERSKIVDVKVLDSKNSPSCKQHWEPLLKHGEKVNKLLWEWTAPNSVAMIPCPRGFIGYVQRPCLSSGSVHWGRSDFSRCISERLRRINSTLQNAKRGFGDWQASNGVKLMTQLEKYLTSNQILYPGEGEKIIAIMEDIIKYTFDKGKVTSSMFQTFFGTVVKLLKIPNSCVQDQSVLTLSQIIVEMAVRGAMHAYATENDKLSKPNIILSEVVMLQILPINTEAKLSEIAYSFPQKDPVTNDIVTWLKSRLHVIFPLDSEGFRSDANSPLMRFLIIAAYKNLSLLLMPNDASVNPTVGINKKNYRTSIELITPVVQLALPDGYYFPSDSHIKIQFNLSKEHSSQFTRSSIHSAGRNMQTVKGTYYSCGALNRTNTSTNADSGRLRWTKDACVMNFQHYSHGYVECQCDEFGIFGLLKVSTVEDEIPEIRNDIPRIIIAGFSFCILSCVFSATIICVYLKCQICFNSLYALKLFDCLFVSSALFIVLLGRTDVPSTSWLVWSASSCSCLISSLSVQITKTLRVLLMEASPSFPVFIFPWLKNVSQVTLLSAITFSTVLPVWTASAAKIFGENSSNDSAFKETSPVFAVFSGTVLFICLIFFCLFYKAVLKTKTEIAGYQQEIVCSTSSSYASEMKWILNYRLKTLHRSLGITLNVLIMILGIVLYENLQQSITIRYFLGFSSTAMGIALLLAYVSQSEYPLYVSICKPGKLLKKDPEKDVFKETKGSSQRKLYAISSEVTGNGSIVGTTGLLPQSRPPRLRDTERQLGDDSETLSVSTVEEQSMDTFSTEMSFRTAPQPPTSQKIPALNKRNNRSIRSAGSNTKSSNGSSCRGSRRISSTYSSDGFIPQPSRCRCLLSSGDYIEPSIRNTSIIDRSSVQTESSASSSGTYNNYLQINDQDEIQKKISHDLSILLPLHDKK